MRRTAEKTLGQSPRGDGVLLPTKVLGGTGSDVLSGEGGDDAISADFLFNDGTDTVEGARVATPSTRSKGRGTSSTAVPEGT
jgi:hypothetical protein